MAKAPKPGVTAREDALVGDQQLITVTIDRDLTRDGRPIQRSHSIGINNIPLSERLVCRKATGFPLTYFWASPDSIDVDSLQILWWMARRLNGESTLTIQQAEEDWPNDLDVASDITVEVSDGSEDDDEGDDDPES